MLLALMEIDHNNTYISVHIGNKPNYHSIAKL